MYNEYSYGSQDDTSIRKSNTNLYVKNFDIDVSEGDLCEWFEPYGIITSCKIARDEYDRSKGFGFVNFKEPLMAADAIDALNNAVFDNGRILYVAYHQPKAMRKPRQQSRDDRNLYVSNLDESIDDEALYRAFARFGIVTSVKVMRKNGRSKGYGFVCFETFDEAFSALNQTKNIKLGSKPIYVEFFKRQERRSQSAVFQPASRTTTQPTFNPVNTSTYTAAFPWLSNRPSLFDSQFSNRLRPSNRNQNNPQ